MMLIKLISMKKIFKALMILLLTISVSCEKEETLGVSRITNYPIITLNGESTLLIDTNDTFTDPGAIAKEGEEEIETETSISKGTYFGQEFSTKTPDQYLITYSAENKDGFEGKASRTVWYYSSGDLNNSLEGIYISSAQRAPSFTPLARYTDLKYVLIRKTGADTYTLSHALGGYYDLGRKYGPRYSAGNGTIKVNSIADNDYTLTNATIPGWGLSIQIQDFKVDAANSMITYTGVGTFGNGTFRVQLKKVEL